MTTVIVTADPIAPKIFTEEATKQNYFPEWVYGGGALVDTNAFGRTYDQKQWAHAFGISSLAATVSPAIVKQYDLHTWYFGDLAPADDTLRRALPAAGAVLRRRCRRPARTSPPTRSARGCSVRPPTRRAAGVTAPLITYGDHGLWPDRARLLRHRRLHRDLVGPDRDR